MGQTTSSAVTTTAVAGRPVFVTTAKSSTSATARPVFVTSTPTTSAQPVSTTGASGYTNLGCYQDFAPNARTLNGYSFTSSSMTIELCESTCNSKGYQVAGVEYSTECYCGTAITQCASKLASTSCQMTCGGNSKALCGGSNALNIYAVSSYSVSTSGCSTPTSTLKATTKASSTTAVAATTSAATATAGNVASTSSSANGRSANKVFAHFMIGNTYAMQGVSDYQTQIAKAIAMGIDGFACNVGSDTWQPNRLGLMYQAAQSYPGFVIFVSLDMSVLASVQFPYLNQFITPYTSHSNQYNIGGKQFVSTFAGETYTNGYSDPQTAWLAFKNQLAAQGVNIYFLPSFTGAGATCLGWSALDGAFSWNAFTKSTDEDAYYLSVRNSYPTKTYMAGIGPLFYSHFNYKNWVYGNDDLYTTRWDNIIAEQPDFVEIISWNDYGESHYIGDIVGSLPYDSNGEQSSSWAYSPQFDHSALGALTKYYITAYKNRAYPAVTSNSLFMWYRPHSINAVASADPYGKPVCQSSNCPVDNIYLTVLLTSSATVTVTSGGSSQTFNGVSGRNYFQFVGFGTGTPSVTVTQAGSTKLSKSAGLAISNTITQYNYNLHYDSWSF